MIPDKVAYDVLFVLAAFETKWDVNDTTIKTIFYETC